MDTFTTLKLHVFVRNSTNLIEHTYFPIVSSVKALLCLEEGELS